MYIAITSCQCSGQVRVRFGDVDGAKTALEKAKEADEGKITFKNIELNCTVLEGKN